MSAGHTGFGWLRTTNRNPSVRGKLQHQIEPFIFTQTPVYLRMLLIQLWQKRCPHSVCRGWHRTKRQASQQYLASGVSTKWSLNPPWRGRKPATHSSTNTHTGRMKITTKDSHSNQLSVPLLDSYKTKRSLSHYLVEHPGHSQARGWQGGGEMWGLLEEPEREAQPGRTPPAGGESAPPSHQHSSLLTWPKKNKPTRVTRVQQMVAQ